MTFEIFENKIIELKTFNIRKNYKINIYYIPSDASLEQSIQVRKQICNREFVIQNFERFDLINIANVKRDTLYLEISDSSGRVNKKNMKIPLY